MIDSIPVQLVKPMIPANELERLAALHRYQILDTPAEAAFDRLTMLAARLFKVPTVLISLVDESRAWFKSSIGFSAPEVRRNDTLCSFAVLSDEPLIIPDARLDNRFACNPFVQCEPGMRFYAGAPSIDRDGFNLGTLCLLDGVPHAPLTGEQQSTLVDLAAMVVSELELRLAAQQIASVDAALVEITQGVARVTGGAFFDELVKHFAKVLGADYVYIGLVEGTEPKMMRTIATCNRGNIVENFEYRLQDTPCWETIEQRKLCCYPRNVKAQFPDAPMLQSLPVESYIAIPFYGAEGNVLGLLGVVDGKPLANVHLAESLLTIFASRIATELERQQYELMLVEQTRLLEAVSTGQPLDDCLSAMCSSIEKLSESEELTRRILESNRDCIKVVDLAGRLIYMNDYGKSLMEIDDFSTVTRSQWLEFWQDDDRESARTAFSIALTGGVDRFDGYCATCKGTPKWWEVIVTPILAADGQVSQILSVSRDITERKIAELNDGFLYELTQRLRHITDPEAIQWEAVKSIGEYLGVDRSLWYEVGEGRVARVLRDWDRAGVDSIVGDYPLDKFLSPTFQAAMFAGEPMAISDVTADPLTADYSDNYQQVRIRAFANIPCLDDEGRWVMTLHLNTSQNVRSWRDDEIQLMQTLVTQLWSFVAEARAMQALRAQEQQTRAAQAIVGQQLGEIESIYQMAPVGLCFVDTDFRYVRINEQLAQINGLSVAEHIGKTFGEVLPELVNTMEPVYRQTIESGAPIIDLEVTGTNRAQPRVERCWLASFYPQTDDRGRVIGVNNVVQEITDRKQAQADLEERNRELDSFVYVVSHDLKAPLRAVANLSQWIEDDLDGQLTADTQSQMNLLRSRVARMAATIDGLLDYARVGRSEDAIETVAVAQLLAEVIDSVVPPSTFTIDLPAELPTLFTKRPPLFQVFVNLIGNGIKHHYSEAGKIQIAIAEQRNFYEFVVSDDGSGIAPEHQERMFQIFQAVNPQNRSDSTGIGLVIVKKIIEAEGGTIWLKSEIGKGTTFYFTWPKYVI